MKTFLLLLLLQGQLYARSVVPERVVTPLINIFSIFNKEIKNEQVKVVVTTFNQQGEFLKDEGRAIIDKPLYELFRVQASAVFEALPEGKDWVGTAFHIGENLVLTNAHVLSRNFSNTTRCDGFRLLDRETGRYFSCKKVHHCNVEHDICLIEMNPLLKTRRNCFFCKGEKVEAGLGASLKIREHYEPDFEVHETAILTAIGNTRGFGIHVSRGRGVFQDSQRHRTYFYAPISGGNSGGALIDEEGLVVGVVKQETFNKISSNPYLAFNIAASSGLVV